MNEYLMTLIGSAVSGMAAFYFGIKKNQKEVEEMGLRNIERSLAIYNKIIDDLKNEIADLRNEITKLEEIVEQLRSENQRLHQEIIENRNKY